MQTSLVIQPLRRDLPATPARPATLRRVLGICRRWFSSYELGTDEKIRRFTGAR